MPAVFQTDSATPLYRQFMQLLQSSIDEGTYPVGSKLPSEQEFCKAYGVSRITVRKALEELAGAGVLERKQGKGTFVSTPRVINNLRPVSSFHDACARLGKKASCRVVHCRTAPAGPEDQKELHLSPGSRLVETCRIMLADGAPVMLEYNRFSMAYSYLLESELSGSLYNLLREYGVEPAAAEHDISLRRAGETEAVLLGVPAGTPLLFLRETIYDQKGRPLHTSHQYIRGDLFTLRI